MNQALTPRATRRLLALILGVYALLAIAYSVASPPFETPDENLHYFTADFIARNGRLPTTSDPGGMGQEAAQPPLYYAAAALLIRALTAMASRRNCGPTRASTCPASPATCGSAR